MNPLYPDVVVNGEPIPHTAIAAETQNHNAPGSKPGLAWRAAARALVVRSLLLQAADKAGLSPNRMKISPDKEETTEEALIRAFLETELTPAPVTEADCRAVYEARPPEAAKLSYDDVVRDICEGLERQAWAKAARELVARLVEAADIQGIDMSPKADTPTEA